MKNNMIQKIIYGVTAFIQVFIIIGVFVLQYLTNKKAGVMRHIYYRKSQFESSIFSPENINIQKMITILTVILLIAIAIYIIKKRKNTFLNIQLILGIIISVVLYIVINSNYFVDKLAYHYFIVAFALVLLIQIIIIIGTLIFNRTK